MRMSHKVMMRNRTGNVLRWVGTGSCALAGGLMWRTYGWDGVAKSLELAPVAGLGLWMLQRSHPQVYAGFGCCALISAVSLSMVESQVHQFASSHKAGLLQSVHTDLPKEPEVAGIPYEKAMYLLPILFAPVAHVLVSVAGSKQSFTKAKPFLAGALAVTVGAIAQRLYLMEDAGVDSGRGIIAAKQTQVPFN